MSFAVHAITIILTFVSAGVYGRKPYAYFENLDCQHYDATYADTMKCWLQPDQNGQLMMNAEFKLKKDLNNLVSKFQFIAENNKKNITYLSVDIDICTVLGAAMKNPIIRLIAEEARRKSNLPLGCPLKKGILYGIHNFTINNKLIPPFAPRIRWIADSNMYTNTGKSIDKILHYVSMGRVDHTK